MRAVVSTYTKAEREALEQKAREIAAEREAAKKA